MGCCNNTENFFQKLFEKKCCHVKPCCCGRTQYASLGTRKQKGISDYNRVYDERTTSPCCCCHH